MVVCAVLLLPLEPGVQRRHVLLALPERGDLQQEGAASAGRSGAWMWRAGGVAWGCTLALSAVNSGPPALHNSLPCRSLWVL